MRLLRGVGLTTLILLVSLVAVQPAFAQDDTSNEDEGIGIGALAMLTRSSYKADGLDDYFTSRNGTGFGLWVGGNKKGLLGFTGEFIYLIKRVEDPFGDILKTQALEIPAVFHINVGSRSRNGVTAYGLVGPVFTLNLKQTRADIDISDDFSGADLGIMAGGGVEFFRIGVEARGNWGLRNINADGDTIDVKTFGFELVGKIRFN